MAVKRCPRCGDLYLAAVDVCADCGDTLVEVEERESPPTEPESAAAAATRGDQDVWELDAWTPEGRRLLDGMLHNADIPRAWQGGSLVTPGPARDVVAEMVAEVARGDARVGLDDDALAAVDAESAGTDTIGYEVSDWSAEELDQLAQLLGRDGVPFGWDEDGDLVVAAVHEVTVDAIFSEISGSGATEEDESDGTEALETLSDLFLAADSLARNALDMAAARSLAEAAERAGSLRLPFGFSPKVWESILADANQLSADLESDDVDDDAIEASAGALRTTLRDYI